MTPLKLTGKRFGRWIVLGPAGYKKRNRGAWRCRCNCGAEKVVDTQNLLEGHSKSCGCLSRELSSRRQLKNLEGIRFGRLLVLNRVENKGGTTAWKCLCDCGTEKIIRTLSLTCGDTTSCGCFHKERITGAKNPFWKGGVSLESARIRVSAKYKAWRISVFTRDNFLCQECGDSGRLNAHHIKSFSAFPELRFEISNGQTLCVPCHEKTPSYLKPNKL